MDPLAELAARFSSLGSGSAGMTPPTHSVET
jgi:hypothetical protein